MSDSLDYPAMALLEAVHYLGHLSMPCAYLDGRDSNLRFLEGHDIGERYRQLLDLGYRRHGEHLYRPDCGACTECQVLRVAVRDFAMSRSQRRIFRKTGGQLRFEIGEPHYTPEKGALYRAFVESRYGRKADLPPDGRDTDSSGSGSRTDERSSYEEFFVQSLPGVETQELRLYALDDAQLVGVGIIDQTQDALSSVYFYFDPKRAALSPGTYSMLLEIALASERGLNYYYPGYFIEGCAAMNYKARLQPCQVWRSGQAGFRPYAGLPVPPGAIADAKSSPEGEKTVPEP